jgi:hypothetical protein
MPEDHYVRDIRERLAETKSHLAALESGRLRYAQQRPGEGWVDNTDARIASFKRDIAMYEAILTRESKRRTPDAD